MGGSGSNWRSVGWWLHWQAVPADHTPTLRGVRFVFTAYLVLIAVGLAFYIAIGITNHQ